MGFIDHIAACNNHDLTKFAPFLSTTGDRIGWIKKDHLELLSIYRDALRVKDDQVVLKDMARATEHMDFVCRDLHKKGHLKNWREERYKVCQRFTDLALFEIERAATSFFGIRAFGVHLNGFVQNEDGIKLWVGKRAVDRPICPGMYDNMVAGGQPAGLGLMENLVKECAEEANVPEQLARQAKPVGTISYMMETDGGIKPDVMFCYDLELPESFTPVNTDGETESFDLWHIDQVADHIREGGNFKFNCNLVIIDFLIRHGVIDPDGEADYQALVSGLRR